MTRRTAMIVPAALLAVASTASAQIQINEIVINPPGADNGREYVELRATGPVSIPSGLHLLQIDGDGTSAGVIDFAWDLSTATFGSNGLLLRRDSAAVLNPAPEAGTNVIVQDFAPDLENGSGSGEAAASVEDGLARTLGLSVGDRIRLGESSYELRAEIGREQRIGRALQVDGVDAHR